ncbi:type II toxin-antitoxin system VapC family toxin [Sphingomonas sp.]|jgi:PIN domain nuclease of toxin-antitoxin system|uniref:type II toxin-antitoxin system VapC family toxin n=1 Tax=Sphingomonas sp. TaxID=28214 RepID=UPI002ED9BAD3
MRLLLDTHALIWWAADIGQLSARARDAIENGENEVFASAISAMEIATKVRIGKLEEGRPLATDFMDQIRACGLQPLALTAGHGQLAGSLTIAHKDPFDRMLIAQAMIENMTFVSNERIFDAFGVIRLW